MSLIDLGLLKGSLHDTLELVAVVDQEHIIASLVADVLDLV
jgi:hypothetical protein